MARRQGFWEARIGVVRPQFSAGNNQVAKFSSGKVKTKSYQESSHYVPYGFFWKRECGRVTNEKFEAGLVSSPAPGSVVIV